MMPIRGEVSLDPATGEGTILRVRRRPILFETNVLIAAMALHSTALLRAPRE